MFVSGFLIVDLTSEDCCSVYAIFEAPPEEIAIDIVKTELFGDDHPVISTRRKISKNNTME